MKKLVMDIDVVNSNEIDIDKALQNLAEDGFGSLLQIPEIKAATKAKIRELGCKPPFDSVVYTSLTVILSKFFREANFIGSEFILSRAIKWKVFTKFVSFLQEQRSKWDAQTDYKKQLLAVLRGEKDGIEAEVDEFTDLDILSALKSEKDLEKISDSLQTTNEEISNLINAIPKILVEPIVVNPGVGLADRHQQLNNFQKLYFGSSFDKFIGREEELGFLEGFLEGHWTKNNTSGGKNFRWQLLYGSGGVGKSRLALELLKLKSGLWRGGFLDVERTIHKSLEHWEPTAPTLFVIDYSQRDIKSLSQFLSIMSQKAEHFAWPVRVLLLDRMAGTWFNSLVHEYNGINVEAFMYSEPKSLSTYTLKVYDDLYTLSLSYTSLAKLMNGRLKGDLKEEINDAALIQKLLDVDPEGRPLFALIVADEINQGTAIQNLTRSKILARLIKREEHRFWHTQNVNAQAKLHSYKNLLAISTMVRSTTIEEIESRFGNTELSILALNQLNNFDQNLFEKMSGKLISNKRCELLPLEPDLIGELFCLEHLKGHLNLEVLLNIACNLNHKSTAEFLVRCTADYPNETIEAKIIDILPSLGSNAILTFLRSLPEIVLNLCNVKKFEEALEIYDTASVSFDANDSTLSQMSAVALCNLAFGLSKFGHSKSSLSLDMASSKLANCKDSLERNWLLGTYSNYTYGCVENLGVDAFKNAQEAYNKLKSLTSWKIEEDRHILGQTCHNLSIILLEKIKHENVSEKNLEILSDLCILVEEFRSEIDTLANLNEIDFSTLSELYNNCCEAHLKINCPEKAEEFVQKIYKLTNNARSNRVWANYITASFNIFDHLVEDRKIEQSQKLLELIKEVPNGVCDKVKSDALLRSDWVIYNYHLKLGDAKRVHAKNASDALFWLIQFAIEDKNIERINSRRLELYSILHRHELNMEKFIKLEETLTSNGFPTIESLIQNE